MNKFKKALASGALAATLAISGSAVGQVAMATPEAGNSASAYSITTIQKWQTDRYWNGTRWMCGVWEYRIHTWWEKLWGAKDGWYRAYWAYC